MYLLPNEKAGALPRFESGTIFPKNSNTSYLKCFNLNFNNNHTLN